MILAELGVTLPKPDTLKDPGLSARRRVDRSWRISELVPVSATTKASNSVTASG